MVAWSSSNDILCKLSVIHTAPYYGSASAGLQGQDPQDLDQEVQAEATTQLYQRIQALSDQIHTELDTMIDIESVSSHQPTPLPPEEHSMRTSLDTSRDSDLFLLEQIHSNINSDKCKDIVLVPDKEEDVLSPRDCDSTLTASSATVEPLFNSMDPKLKKAIEKMRKLDEKLADLDKVTTLTLFYMPCVLSTCNGRVTCSLLASLNLLAGYIIYYRGIFPLYFGAKIIYKVSFIQTFLYVNSPPCAISSPFH